jgi:hypothetical protein
MAVLIDGYFVKPVVGQQQKEVQVTAVACAKKQDEAVNRKHEFRAKLQRILEIHLQFTVRKINRLPAAHEHVNGIAALHTQVVFPALAGQQ